MKNIFAVIVTFNPGKEFSKLVENLLSQKLNGAKLQIVIIDNGSSKEIFDQYESGITIIKNKGNLGFAKGVNIGIKYALKNNADKILFLNQDTVVETGFILPLFENSADIVSPVIKFKRGNKWVCDYGGVVNWRIGRTYHVESVNHPIDYVSGCCMLVKKRVFEKIGLFDERFFLYFEDADFCLRAKKEGFRIAVEAKSVIEHKLAEGKEKSFFKNWHLLRSNAIFINKYLGLNRFLGYFYLLLLAGKMIL